MNEVGLFFGETEEKMDSNASMKFIVTEQEEGWSVRAVLRQKLQLSRRLLIRLKQLDDGIKVNGTRVYVSYIVHKGDVIEVHMPEEHSETIKPEYFPIDILYEDEDLLAINKPPGRVVHPTHGHYEQTIANAVMYHWHKQGKRHRFRAVHRLDRNTSGVLLIAKNPYVHQQISLQMEQGQMKKGYIAYVHSVPFPSSGTICASIGRDPNHPHRRKVMNGGAFALTHYGVIEHYKGGRFSKIWVRIETGRTHQIRVHMQFAGCPILGDDLYGYNVAELHDKNMNSRQGHDKVERNEWINRQALHAMSLQFIHPIKKQPLHLTAAIPEDLRHLENQLRK